MEAKEALVRFVFDARSRGKRCVLIVHGRGLHSKDQIPVLKASLQTWLSHGKLAERVLAFTSARPHDGGAGAVYVLLRK
jgi:DNA-nicking Smr family endonuclease